MSAIDADFLGQLLDRHGAALELYAAQWYELPEDVVQEAFLELVRQSSVPERIVPWLYRVVRNRAISAARSQNRRKRREHHVQRSAAHWFESNADAELDAELVVETLEQLPAEEREVLVARIWGGLTFEQIAEVTAASSSTTHRRYEAGLKSLRERLGITWLSENS